MEKLSDLIVPLLIASVLCYGCFKRVKVFDVFMQGAKEGMQTAVNILPALIAIMLAIGMFKVSGALDVLTYALRPLANLLHLPCEVVPLALLRPISGSGAMVVFEDILKTYHPDSFIGRVASVMQGSTETTFYTIAIYFGATKAIKTRYTLVSSLAGDITGFLVSVFAVTLLFGTI